MLWDKPRISDELRRLNRRGIDLSYNSLAKKKQSLVSAAAYHFGSYRRAVEAAGIPYDSVVRRPRWTKQAIIRLIKDAKRKNADLHWSAVTRRRDELGRAAFASLQPRLFGKWDRALHAAGLDADEVSRYRKWDRNSVVYELRARASDQEALNSGAIQREDSGLHAAAVRHFGSYDAALRAAKVDPDAVRRRRSWTKPEVLQSLKQAHRHGQNLSDSSIRKDNPALYGAAVRLFGTFTSARHAAKIPWKRNPDAGSTMRHR
ncbi:MAG TPA: hypothetical protein VF669_17980 [Tepidisphaeraceae bacterium]|jgi:hypothetical protein